MILYLDTSALVKRYVMETGSPEVLVLIAQADTVGSIVLTRVEMAATFAKAVRQKWIERRRKAPGMIFSNTGFLLPASL